MTPPHKTQLGHSKLMSLQVLLFGTHKWLDVGLLRKPSLTHSQSGISFIYSFIYLHWKERKKMLHERNKFYGQKCG